MYLKILIDFFFVIDVTTYVCRYSILGMTAALMIMSFAIMGRRPFNETFASFWSAGMLFLLSIGGTMIMRKFHNSMAVGFFMGSICTCSQMFFSLSLVYLGYGRDQAMINLSSKEEKLMAFLALLQSILLGSFAAILAAHRSEILDKPATGASISNTTMATGVGGAKINNGDDSTYEAPTLQQARAGRV
jgi:hypothetical protein